MRRCPPKFPSAARPATSTVERLEPRCLLTAVNLTSLPRGLIANDLYPLGDKLIVSAESNGPGLWVSDGTAAGTVQFESGVYVPSEGYRFNADDGRPTAVQAGGRLFFGGSDGGLYTTDGTAAGTVLVRTFDGNRVSISNLTPYAGGVVFSVNGFGQGEEPWYSDGTSQGTYPLAQLLAGPDVAFARDFTDVDGTLFFTAFGNRLYKSDGSAAGTVPVNDTLFNFGADAGTRDMFLSYGGKLLFEAQPESLATRQTLWTSDGTVSGTRPLALPPGVQVFHGLVRYHGLIYFEAQDASDTLGLWRTDGTDAGTYLVKTIPLVEARPGQLIVAGETLYFVAGDAFSLWKSDGTTDGTTLVRTFPQGPNGIDFPVNADATLYFLDEMHVWTTDGTAAGTVEVDPATPPLLSAFPLVAVDGQVFFLSSGGDGVPQLATIVPAVKPPLPQTPGSFTAAAPSGSEVDLAWAAGSGLAGYTIERSTDPAFQTIDRTIDLPDASATGYADTTVTPGTTYYYRLSAYNRTGHSNGTTATAATPATPAAPSDLVATPYATHVDLTWTDNASNETGYVVERSPSPAFATIDARFSLGPDHTSFSDTTVRPLGEYFYRVAAVNGVGRSRALAVRVATPDYPPTGLTATAVSDTEIDLTWTLASTTQIRLRVDRAAPGGDFQQVAPIGANLTTYADKNLPPGSHWIYRITQVGLYSGSSSSGTATAATFPAGDADGNGKVDLADLLALARNYGIPQATLQEGDFNHDGKVDFSDLLILAQHYGQSVKSAVARRYADS
jgi:ELWxxDGT repeat protein